MALPESIYQGLTFIKHPSPQQSERIEGNRKPKRMEDKHNFRP